VVNRLSVTLSERQWTSSELLALRGATEPRIFTPPLRELTPETSEGYDVIAFAELIGRPLDPWQQFAVIHGMELLPDGRPRFRQILILVGRQNGKTELLVVLSAYWLFLCRLPMILGTSTQLPYAAISWEKVCKLARTVPLLADDLPRTRNQGIRRANGEQSLTTKYESVYKIAAANEEGGRSLTIDRLVEDELRQHKSWIAHEAAENAGNAVDDFQNWMLSNQGDSSAVVLDSLRDSALEFIETGQGDQRLGLLEWSAPDGSEVDDPLALAAANPNLGHRIHIENLLGKMARAKAKGGEQEMTAKIEVLCMRVRLLDPALDPASWARCKDAGPLGKRRTVLFLDVAPNQLHCTLMAAAVLDDGRVRVKVVRAWEGIGCTRAAAADLPGLVTQTGAKMLGWFPGGPAASLAADLKDRKGRSWPPSGVTVEEVRAETPAVCMGFEQLVRAGQVAHPDDPLINAHVEYAEKLHTGAVWVFSRKGEGHVDAAYAAAGAAHLARTQPRGVGRPRVIVVPS
jgi:hypothetical protein